MTKLVHEHEHCQHNQKREGIGHEDGHENSTSRPILVPQKHFLPYCEAAAQPQCRAAQSAAISLSAKFLASQSTDCTSNKLSIDRPGTRSSADSTTLAMSRKPI